MEQGRRMRPRGGAPLAGAKKSAVNPKGRLPAEPRPQRATSRGSSSAKKKDLAKVPAKASDGMKGKAPENPSCKRTICRASSQQQRKSSTEERAAPGGVPRQLATAAIVQPAEPRPQRATSRGSSSAKKKDLAKVPAKASDGMKGKASENPSCKRTICKVSSQQQGESSTEECAAPRATPKQLATVATKPACPKPCPKPGAPRVRFLKDDQWVAHHRWAYSTFVQAALRPPLPAHLAPPPAEDEEGEDLA
eukprot:EG_transcript_23350